MNLLLDYGLQPCSLRDSCEMRDRKLENNETKRNVKVKVWVYLILLFSNPPWVEGGGEVNRTQRNPPSSYKVHVLNHVFLSLRVQLSPILMELKPNKSPFYAFSPSSLLAKSCANLQQFPSARLWNDQDWSDASTNQFIGVLKLTKT